MWFNHTVSLNPYFQYVFSNFLLICFWLCCSIVAFVCVCMCTCARMLFCYYRPPWKQSEMWHISTILDLGLFLLVLFRCGWVCGDVPEIKTKKEKVKLCIIISKGQSGVQQTILLICWNRGSLSCIYESVCFNTAGLDTDACWGLLRALLIQWMHLDVDSSCHTIQTPAQFLSTVVHFNRVELLLSLFSWSGSSVFLFILLL